LLGYDRDTLCALTNDGALYVWKSSGNNFLKMPHQLLEDTKIKQIYDHVDSLLIWTEHGKVYRWFPLGSLEDLLPDQELCIKVKSIVFLTLEGNVYWGKWQIDTQEKIKNIYRNYESILTQNDDNKIRVWDQCGLTENIEKTKQIQEYSKDKEIMKIFEFPHSFVTTYTDYSKFIGGPLSCEEEKRISNYISYKRHILTRQKISLFPDDSSFRRFALFLFSHLTRRKAFLFLNLICFFILFSKGKRAFLFFLKFHKVSLKSYC
jgi:hypothetical protein